MYAVFGENAETRKMLTSRFGKPRPGGFSIVSPSDFFGLICQVAAEVKAENATA